MVTGDVSIGHTYFWRNIWWYVIKCTIVWWCYLFNPRFPTICFVINNLNNSFYNTKFVELQLRLLHDVFIFHAGVWIKIVSNHTLIYFYLFHNINIWKNIRFDAFSVAWSNEVFMLSSYFQGCIDRQWWTRQYVFFQHNLTRNDYTDMNLRNTTKSSYWRLFLFNFTQFLMYLYTNWYKTILW